MDLLLASLAGAAEVKRSAKMDDVPRPGVLCQLNSDSDNDGDGGGGTFDLHCTRSAPVIFLLCPTRESISATANCKVVF